MNDQQVKQQIQQMVSFIRQEADEKANEIRVKAEEDFNIRKLTAVEAAREKIRVEFDRKAKQIEVEQKVARSKELNTSRLTLLKARDEILREIYDETDKRIASIAAQTPKQYNQLLRDIVLQGLLALSDDEVVVRCRQADIGVVETVLPQVASDYSAKTGKAVAVTVDTKTFLSDNCTGGVTLFSEGGKIMLENTFESRLEIAYQQNLPTIRGSLFGDGSI
mmetsp:Transcript_48770/g.119431  ORF Transcript_48770/g.119431 Transcript_48770/m.119431 type:complete len:221 (-) Transcript_48770:152-814(-)